ncbi:tape measure protein [Gordonia phage Ligma]|nr:tape measure protein [Gordonia phage Ligma]UQT02125.1 tape measure protein [Gordonia phage Axumite]
MTSPAGSIGIGVDIDASDLASEITQAVTSQLRPVLAAVQGDVSRLAREMGNIDTSGITDAARDTDRLGEAADRTRRSVDNETDATERNTRSQRDNSQQTEETTQRTSRLGEAFEGAKGKIAGFAAGIGGIGAIMAGVSGAIEQNSLGNKLQAQLNLTADEAAKAGKLTGDLYASNFGGSVEEVNSAVGAVQSTIGRLGEDSDEAFKSMTASALTMADVFEVDVAESTQTANNLIRNGLAKDGVEAMDLLTAAMQRMPANMRAEVFPVMDEYSTYFQSIGFSGQEAMGIIVNASQNGQIAMDKAGDAIKEFGIRATDLGDKGAMDAIKSIGLDSTQMANDLLAGGDRAQGAFDKIVSGLLSMDDPAQQAAASVALFGTPLEDLDKAKIPGFLKGLSTGADAMGDFAGSAEDMKNTMAQGPAAAMETVRRSIEQGLVGALGTAAQWMVENKTQALVLAGAVGTLVAAYAGYRTVAAVSGVIQGVSAAMRGVEIATTASTTAQRANTVATTLQSVAQRGMAVAAGIARGAMLALNAAFVSGPWGWIVLAIAGIVTAITLFFTKTEAGKAVFEQLKQWIVVAWDAIKNAIVGAWQNYIWPALQAVWDFITNTLAPVFVWLYQTVITPIFNLIKTLISAWWNFYVKPIFTAFMFVIQQVLAPVLTWLWQSVIVPVFNAIATVISAWWNNFVKPVWDAFVWVLQNVLAPIFSWLWNTIIVPAMNGIAATIGFVWNNVIKPVWDAFVWVLQNVLAPIFGWLWNTIIKPAMDGIGAVISFAWNNVIKPVIDFMLGGWRSIGDVLSAVWNNIIKPVWEFLGNLIKSVWEGFISPAFDAIKNGVRSVGDFFSDVVDGIGNVWNGMKSLLAKPVNFLINTVWNGGILKAWNAVADFLPGIDPAAPLQGIPEHRTGGKIRGPGGIDNVLMWGTAGEHMMTVQEVMRAGGHNLVYAMRDMIARGVPFTWDNGRLRPTETSNPGFSAMDRALQSYGNLAGIGALNRAPQGMFAGYYPKGYKRGGEIEPWMLQLQKGHEFAKKYSPLPYVAGNQLPTGADCSGWMSAIADVILGGSGLNGSGHWSTVAFPAAQAAVVNAANQVWHGGLKAFTLSIGMQGGPDSGGANGHTRGTLGAVPELGIGSVNVESGGGTGQGPTYGPGAQSAAGMPTAYHIPIGPNGFFEGGSGSGAPSPEEQRSFIEKKIKDIFDKLLKPVRDGVDAVVPEAPPAFYDIPRKFLDKAPDALIEHAVGLVGNLGSALSSTWTKAKDTAGDIVGGLAHAANPLNWFDSGGVANGKGMMAKNVISPERILSPQQTQLFEVLVQALTQIAGFKVSDFTKAGGAGDETLTVTALNDATGRMASDTAALIDRTESSRAATAAAQNEQQQELLSQVIGQLSEKVFAPMIQTGVSGAMQAATTDGTMNALGQAVGQVAGATITAAMSNAQLFDSGGSWESGSLGMNLSGHTERVLDPSQTRAFDAGLLGGWNLQPQQQHFAGSANDTLGADFFGVGGPVGGILNILVRTLLEVTGVEIEVRNTLTDMTSEIRQFRGDMAEFDASGRLTGDTSGLTARSESSEDLVVSERLRILKQVIMGLVKFVIEKIIVPMLNALFQGLIQMATTGIGGAIGTALGGPLGTAAGTAVGNVVGQVVGAGLGGLASVATSVIGGIITAGMGAILDGAFGLFDDGGIANGVGFMPKATIQPERVLNPSNTKSFDRFVDLLAKGDVSLGGGRTTTIHAPFTVVGGERGGKDARDRLLELMS